jgi:hypothetical protein
VHKVLRSAVQRYECLICIHITDAVAIISHSVRFCYMQASTYRKYGKCDGCHRWNNIKSDDNIHFRCRYCIKKGIAKSTASSFAESDAADALMSLSSVTLASPHIHSRRKWIDRWRCVVYQADGCSMKEIIDRVHTTRKTIKRWVQHYANSESNISYIFSCMLLKFAFFFITHYVNCVYRRTDG